MGRQTHLILKEGRNRKRRKKREDRKKKNIFNIGSEKEYKKRREWEKKGRSERGRIKKNDKSEGGGIWSE